MSHAFNFSENGADDNAARELEARKVPGSFRYGQRARLAWTNSDCAPDGAKSATSFCLRQIPLGIFKYSLY